MAALDFPASPTVGQRYPDPSLPNTPQYTWDGEKWTTQLPTGGGGTAVGVSFTPTGNVAATNVQDAIVELDNEKVAKSGGVNAVMTGPLTLPGDPVNALEAATKQMVDGKAAIGHGHTASNITDFSEAVDDRVGALLVAGTNVTLNYNDAANALTINATGGGGTAVSTTFTPAGNIAATNVQAAIVELDTEKIGEAPNDALQYARKSLGWAEVVQNVYGNAHNYLFNAGTGAPAAAGSVRFNNVTQNAVTQIFMSYTTNDSIAVNLKTYFLSRVKVGDVFYFQDKDDPNKWKVFTLNAAFTDNGTYATLPVTFVDGGNDITAARIVVSRDSPGAAASGDVTGPGVAVADRVAVFNGTTGKIIKDGGKTIAELGGGGGTAATTTFTPAGNIAATDVQAAIVEVDAEKVKIAGDTMVGPLVLPVGSTAATSINFGGANTGFYGIGTTNLAAAISGVNRLSISGSTITTTIPLREADGTAAAPAYSFTSSADAGLYRSGTNQVSMATSGAEAMRWNADNSVTMSNALKAPNGGATVPSYAFTNEANTGMYLFAGGTLAFTTAGTARMSVSASALVATVPVGLPITANAANNALNWGTAGTGINGDATTVAVSAGGALKFTFGATTHLSNVPIALPADPTNPLEAATKQYADTKAASSHTHTAANITDFSEAVDDRVGALLVAGTNVTLSYNDAGNALTINSSGSGGGTAATTTFTPTGQVAATDVQAAIAEVDTEKAPKASPVFTGTVRGDDGAKATPAFSFSTEPSSGIYRKAANSISMSVLNTDIMTWSSTITQTIGNIEIKKAGAKLILNRNPAGSTASIIEGQRNDVVRWSMQLGDVQASETGSNTGSDFSISRYDDAGTYLGMPFTISRATGKILLEGPPTVPLGAATKAYVDSVVTGGAVPESPNDGVAYNRKTTGGVGAWVADTGGGGGTATTTTFTPYSTIAATNVQAAIQELKDETLYVSGGTVQGDVGATGNMFAVNADFTGFLKVEGASGLQVVPASGSAIIDMRKNTGTSNEILGKNNSSLRWKMILGDGTAEGGSGLGSNFKIERYSDGGTLNDTPLSIDRSTGFVSVAYDPNTALHVATKGYVDGKVGGLPLTGGTLTGPLVMAGTGQPRITFNKDASGKASEIYSTKGGLNRWVMQLGDQGAESGSNAGSDFVLYGHNDSGGYINTAIQIKRSDGLVLLAGDPTAALHAVTKQYADSKAVAPATVAPLINGTATVGTTTKYAREDHIHPTDTSRLAATQLNGGKITISASAPSSPATNDVWIDVS